MLQRLKPSLEQYIGCTIIDINPGVGIFSKKLHEYLRPRNHVLFEPKQDQYLQFLNPLLDAPGSRYCLRDWPDEHRWETTNFIREGLMPDAEGLGGPPPTTEHPNNLALIIGNIANWRLTVHGHRKGARRSPANYPLLKATDYARKVRLNAQSPNAAPPRMLIWMADSDKHSILPRTAEGRTRTSSILEAYCHVEEIAGARSRPKMRREDALDRRSMARVAERMRRTGNQEPKGDQNCPDEARLDLSSTSREWHQELRDLEEGFRAEKLSQFVGLPPGPLKRIKRGAEGNPERTPEYEKMLQLRGVLAGQNREIKMVGELVRKQAEIDRMDLEIATSESIDKDKQESKLKELDARIADLKELQAKLTEKQLYRFMFLDDDRRAFEMNPPLLMWDRRNAEPLFAKDQDFHQPQELALVDFQVNPNSNIPPTTSDQNMYYDMLASALLAPKGPTTLRHLNTVGPGAYQALVKNVPSLRDPRKGGRRDIESVRARTMTPEILHDFAVAWDEWPFKPPMADTLAQSDPGMVQLTRGGGPAAKDRMHV